MIATPVHVSSDEPLDARLSTRLANADALAAERGVALTPLRRQVYAAIVVSDRPIGAYDLLSALEPQRGRVPPTTVYRALDFLVEQGFVHRIESKNAFVACCDAGRPHQSQFLICDTCGATVEIAGSALAAPSAEASSAHGFEVHRQVVELSGLCAACRAHANGAPLS
ncbi:Fur family transcriptional regulator [Paraburkholderia sp.]|uniref:Fur family transcriptional regulator n=1 Tax=Paraburkholderia sp. TaxID=1926495 RepID=UPI002390D7E8|nr:Fur family transcriptional regulator [Paraburkholderia sp.]MDE1183154.1 Fur family transcriptional regulator [Paraburkholderia sp.]